MKFAMGTDTLGQLTKRTETSGEDLVLLVRQLVEAGEPLQGKFNGAARSAFDNFKANVDSIAAELNTSLNGVLSGISGMDRAFVESEGQMADSTRSSESSVSFDSARFSARR